MRSLIKVLMGLLLLLTLAVAGFVVVNWAPDRPAEALKARWAPEPSTFISIDGLQVHFRDEGRRDDPEPLVLLHGTSASLHTWQGWVEPLQQNHRIISLDLPGFGLTGPFKNNDYRLDHYQAFLEQFFERLELKQVTLVGNSFGGQLAWLFALQQPHRVGHLVLIDAAGYPRQSSSVPVAFQLAQNPILAPLMANVLPRKMIEASVKNVYGDPTKVTPELIDRYYQLSLREGNRQALIERFKQANSEDFRLLRQLNVPTLILWGGKDRLIPDDSAAHFKRDIKGSRLVIFDDLGHVPHEEDPVRTTAAVKLFLGSL